MRVLLQQHEWEAAVDSLRNLADKSGGQLISVSPPSEPFERFVPLIELLQEILCTLPEDQTAALTVYRQRVDDLAQTWYEQGLRQHDEQLLVRLVREFFPSTWGDNAALCLGDFALERGDCELARSYWRSLHPQLAAEAGAHLRVAGVAAAVTSAGVPQRFPSPQDFHPRTPTRRSRCRTCVHA